MSFIDELAARYGVEVRYESFQGSDAFVMGRTIYLNPDLYPPRMNWKFCHELAHILLGHNTDGAIEREHEREADELAVDLLLPPEEFQSAAATMDLAALKEVYPHVSWEAVARRWIQVNPAVLTIYDNELLTRRLAVDGINYPHRTTAAEFRLVQRCYAEKSHLYAEFKGLKMSAFFVDENRDVVRVILITRMPDTPW